jgi:hypothetical protein
VLLGRLQQQRFLRAEFMPDQPYQNTLQFLNAHIDMLNHSPVQHSRRNIPPPTFLLQVMKTLEDDAFPVGETVSNIGKIGTRITVVQVNGSPGPHAKVMAIMLG